MILTLDNLKPRKENYSVDVDDIDVGVLLVLDINVMYHYHTISISNDIIRLEEETTKEVIELIINDYVINFDEKNGHPINYDNFIEDICNTINYNTEIENLN